MSSDASDRLVRGVVVGLRCQPCIASAVSPTPPPCADSWLASPRAAQVVRPLVVNVPAIDVLADLAIDAIARSMSAESSRASETTRRSGP